jgi:serine/threonine-protein kinase
MSLVAGTRLGPYEIQSAIGAGGMGEVYKARDTRLDRAVAIKVLPAEISGDPDRRARFEREARAIASLNHPHICTLHDVGEHGDATYLVMEHLAGETLAERLQKGRLPPDQALTVATEIADALKAAHRQGITHRDLKPGNVMLTKAGAKLLDFGLAKLAGHGAEPAVAQLVSEATRSAPLTAEGTIVGTLQYMAPEQVEGKPADARTDLWALGSILYEMLTGKRAFEGTSAASLIGNIMSQEPAPVSALQPVSPPGLDRLVRRCLSKSPDDRPDTAHDVADELRWIAQGSEERPARGAIPPRARHRWMLATAVAAIAGLFAGAGVIWLWRPTAPTAAPVARSLISVAPAERLQSVPADIIYGEQRPSRIAMAASPDGRTVVFSAVQEGVQRLYVRPIDQLQASPIQDTEGGTSPFFSPDGKWIGFWANGAIRKVAVAGGPATVVCQTGTGPIFGASWGDDDAIVFAPPATGLLRVSASGGTANPLTMLDRQKGETSHRLPFVLPGAKAVLFTAVTHFLPDWDGAEIVAQPLPAGDRKTIARGADARYAPTGHLTFARWGTIVAAPFDPRRLEMTGGIVSILNDVMQAANTPNSIVESGAAQVALSPSGLLVYATGGIFRDQERELVWVDRSGREELLPLPARAYLGPHLSPDGDRVVLWTQGRDRIVWVYDLRRATMARLTAEGRNSRAIWAPDGRVITYASATGGPEELVSRAADGSGAMERLAVQGQPSSWSPDGRVLLHLKEGRDGEMREVGMFAAGRSHPGWSKDARFGETYPEFSPDGRWIAYVSDETGRNEVYVRPYPETAEKQQISNHGGSQPAWARSGSELFYTEIDGRTQRTRMMCVPLTPGPQLAAGVPRLLFEGNYRGQGSTRGYDVSPDGRRFLMVRPKVRPPSPVTQLVLVQNWFEELKAKVPAGGAK